MNMNKLDIHKFSWAELFNDSKGRTSPGRVVGFIGCITAIFVFAIASLEAVFTKLTTDQTNIILTTITMQSVALFTVSATLLGIRRFTKDKDVDSSSTSENVQ
jgi:hypothetical protein